MTPETAKLNVPTASTSLSFAATPAGGAQRLTNSDTAEVLEFFGERPLHTFVMSGFIRDNGIESELNRGTFYGYRGAAGGLEGGALIGHAIYLDTRSDTALAELARIAQTIRPTHIILGEQQTVARFWNHYAAAGRVPRRVCREILLELNHPAGSFATLTAVRKAKMAELDLIVPIHAALAFEESGVDPLSVDADGFLGRCRRRIEQGRVWVLVEGRKLIFKIDVISDTPDVAYVEGLYVNPKHRGKGYATQCLMQICRLLLRRTQSIAALVNEENRDAITFAEKIGFVPRALYDTIFLETDGE